MKTRWFAGPGIVTALVASMVLMSPIQANAAIWGRYYQGEGARNIWHTSSATQQQFTATRVTGYPTEVTVFARVPNVGTSSAVGFAQSTFSARNVQPSCAWNWSGVKGKAELICENRSA